MKPLRWAVEMPGGTLPLLSSSRVTFEVEVSLSKDGRAVFTSHQVTRKKRVTREYRCRLRFDRRGPLKLIELPDGCEIVARVVGEIPASHLRSHGYGHGDCVALLRGSRGECARRFQAIASFLEAQTERVVTRRREWSTLNWGGCARCDDPDCPGGSMCSEWSN